MSEQIDTKGTYTQVDHCQHHPVSGDREEVLRYDFTYPMHIMIDRIIDAQHDHGILSQHRYWIRGYGFLDPCADPHEAIGHQYSAGKEKQIGRMVLPIIHIDLFIEHDAYGGKDKAGDYEQRMPDPVQQLMHSDMVADEHEDRTNQGHVKMPWQDRNIEPIKQVIDEYESAGDQALAADVRLFDPIEDLQTQEQGGKEP